MQECLEFDLLLYGIKGYRIKILNIKKEVFSVKHLFKVISLLALALVLSVTMFQSGIQAYDKNDSSDTNLSFEEYKGYQDEGILGEDVTYEEWVELVNASKELENLLEDSSEFEEVYSSDSVEPFSSFTMKRGDVVITNGTSSAGIAGHAGIATSKSYILHIAGKGKKPVKISLSNWHKNYTNKTKSSWTKVYRHKSATKASAAAKWTENTYLNSNAEYKITGNLASTSVTYCSKLVWQGYYYGPSTKEANGPTIGYRMPYDLPKTIHNLSHKKTY